VLARLTLAVTQEVTMGETRSNRYKLSYATCRHAVG